MKYEKEIRAALDGKRIQIRSRSRHNAGWPDFGQWCTMRNTAEAIRLMVMEYGDLDFRVEPDPPPPDIVKYRVARRATGYDTLEKITWNSRVYPNDGIVKQVFDGTTGKLKSVEVVNV